MLAIFPTPATDYIEKTSAIQSQVTSRPNGQRIYAANDDSHLFVVDTDRQPWLGCRVLAEFNGTTIMARVYSDRIAIEHNEIIGKRLELTDVIGVISRVITK